MRSLVLLLAKLVRTIETNRLSFLTGSFHLLVKLPIFRIRGMKMLQLQDQNQSF